MDKLNQQKGFSTLEMMIAMAVMVIALSGVILVSFGNQGMLLGGQTNAEAMNMAQEQLERVQQLARKDFRLVNATSSTEDIYTKSVTIEPWVGDKYSSKKITTKVEWNDQRKMSRNVTLTTVVSNFMNAVGTDTCDSSPSGNWTTPIATSYPLDNTGTGLIPTAGTFTIGSIDAYRGRLYVAASNTGNAALPTLFVFDISNPPQKPAYLGNVDNNPSSIVGLNAIHVGNTALVSGVPHTYAYGANAYGASFNTCAQGANCSQMQVFDVTNPGSPTLAYSFKFATSSASIPNALPYVSGTGGAAVGKSIFYKDGYVYLGLTSATGPEFTIIDVHNPLNPIAIGSGFEVGAGVQAIYVRGKYAYLATDDTSKELVVLDISNPLAPTLVPGVYNVPGMGSGNAVYAVGDTMYFGKNFSSPSPEFSVFDISNPSAGIGAPGATRSVGGSIVGMFVRDTLAYILTSAASNQLQIFNIASNPSTTTYVNPSGISVYATATTLTGNGVALDCELNYLYAASNNGAAGNVAVIRPGI